MVVVQSQSELLQVILTLSLPRFVPRMLNRWKTYGCQHGDQGDDDEQFEQREAACSI
jgi:hypothetical protein